MALPAVISGIVGAASSTAQAGGATKAAASLATFGKEVDRVGTICAKAGPSVGMLGGLVGKATEAMTHSLTMWVGMMKSAAGPVAELVAIHNPARVEAFTRALNDAYGVVGRLLTPVLDAFTRSARKLGDFMAGLEGTVAPAMNAVGALVEHVTNRFIETYRKNAPVFEAMADVLVKFANAAMKVADVVFSAIGKILQVGNAVARLFGFDGGSFDSKASAVGAARRDARFVGSKAISDDAIKSSLMQGIGREHKSPEQSLNSIATATGNVAEWFRVNGQKLIDKVQLVERNVDRARTAASGAAAGVAGPLVRWAAAKGGL